MASTARSGTRPTLESVASRAGVSRQTVSNVINAPGLVRVDTIERVRTAIEDLGYRPHRAAQALRTRRSRLIGLRLEPVRDGINGAVLDRFLHALTEVAQTANYRIELFVATDDDAEITQYDQMLVEADVDAFVITGTHHGDPRTTWLAERDVPFVTFGRPWGEPSTNHGHPWVDVDGACGTRAATEHLLRAGHRRIAFLGWPNGSGVGDDRRAGWSKAMLAAGIPADALRDLDHTGTDDVSAGMVATSRLLGRPDPPSAAVCSSDSLALGAMTAATAARAHLEVIGFDDTPVATALGLSSVAQPVAEAAQHALALLVHQMDQTAATRSPPPDPHRLLVPHLVLRQPTFSTSADQRSHR